MTMPNAVRAWAVMDHIEARPELWEQGVYIADTGCDTVACFAGWTALLFGEGEPVMAPTLRDPRLAHGRGWVLPSGIVLNINTYADQLLGGTTWDLGPDKDESIYDGGNTLDDLRRMVTEAFGPRPVTA